MGFHAHSAQEKSQTQITAKVACKNNKSGSRLTTLTTERHLPERSSPGTLGGGDNKGNKKEGKGTKRVDEIMRMQINLRKAVTR